MLEIEEKFNITVNLPQTCVLCFEEITKENGRNRNGLCFHSLDWNHDNWSWGNKVPMHMKCHLAYHSLAANTDKRFRANTTTLSLMPYSNDSERVLYTIRRLRNKNIPVTKTKIMQSTGWLKDKTEKILIDMLNSGTIERVTTTKSNRSYYHYVEALQ